MIINLKKKINAELAGERLIVWNFNEANDLYKLGFYGKPVGIPKPKPGQEFQSPLILDLMEGIYLLEKRILSVTSPLTKKKLSKTEIEKLAGKTYLNFKIGS